MSVEDKKANDVVSDQQELQKKELPKEAVKEPAKPSGDGIDAAAKKEQESIAQKEQESASMQREGMPNMTALDADMKLWDDTFSAAKVFVQKANADNIYRGI